MGGCDSLSPPLLGFSSSFPSLWQCTESFQSHERLWTGISTPTKDIKKALHLHKYRHKYMWQTQAHKVSPHKSSCSLTNTLPLQVVEQSLRTIHDSAPRMFNLWSTLFHSGKLNNLQSSSSPTQNLLNYIWPGLQFISIQAQLLHFLCLNFKYMFQISWQKSKHVSEETCG